MSQLTQIVIGISMRSVIRAGLFPKSPELMIKVFLLNHKSESRWRQFIHLLMLATVTLDTQPELADYTKGSRLTRHTTD